MDNTVEVNLRRSAWSTDKGYWEDHFPGMWERMKQAYEGHVPTQEISTSPSRETRSGTVTISKGCAVVGFSTEWDEPEELLSEIEFRDDDSKEAAIELVEDFDGRGVSVGGVVIAPDFDALMDGIDKLEVELIADDKASNERFELLLADIKKLFGKN